MKRIERFAAAIKEIEAAAREQPWAEVVRVGVVAVGRCVGVRKNKKTEDPTECPYELEPRQSSFIGNE